MSRLALALGFAFCLPVLSGCSKPDEIRTYEVAKQPHSTVESSAAVPTRMLAAILEGERQAWFLKVMAAEEAAAPAAESIKTFLSSVKFDSTALRPTWELPDGWKELPGKGMRLATLSVPTSGEPLELTVIGLGLSADWGTLVLSNVNRWLGQLDLAETTADDLAAGTAKGIKSMEVNGRQLVVVDLQGMAVPGAAMGSSMRGPLIGGPMSSPPASQPPPVAPARTEDGIKHKLPEGWRELPATSMRLVNLSTGDESAPAEVTVFAFSATAPAMADPLANVNRWRKELGLADIDQEQLDAQIEKLEIDGVESSYIAITPDSGAEHTLAAMGRRGDRVWFFKMRGPAETVTAEQQAFREWLKTIEFQP